MKKLDQMFERDLQKTVEIGNVLYKEGQSEGETRYKVVVTQDLVMIIDILRTISRVLFMLLGLELAKLLTSGL